jgi:hypothetical protein
MMLSATTVACCHNSVDLAWSNGICDTRHSVLNTVRMPDADRSTHYRTVISYGDRFRWIVAHADQAVDYGTLFLLCACL